MKKSLFLLCLLLGMLGNCALVLAQPAQKLVNVVVSPDRIDWKCKAKEEVKFTVQVFKNENLLKDGVGTGIFSDGCKERRSFGGWKNDTESEDE